MKAPEHATHRFEPIEYPTSDGQPMADNTKHARWIITLYNNLKSHFQGESVFVAADLLWYPVQGEPTIRQAPDVLIAFGRPDGDRSSYRQWEEAGVIPQVVFEVISPSNSAMEMLRKQSFYSHHGVEELIMIDPGKKDGDPESFLPYLRNDQRLEASQFDMVEWTSPRLGIRFRQEGEEVQVFYPDGKPFKTFEVIRAELAAESQRADQATQRADQATQQAEAEKQRADQAEAELIRLRKLLAERGE
jgi:Uma2 family endonuclease